MNKTILIQVFIGGLFLMGIFFTFKFFLIPKYIQEAIEKLKSPQGQTFQNTTSTSQETSKMLTFGIYEVCADVEECNPEGGIEKIKTAGAEAIIVTVVDEDDLKSVSYYPSQYLSMVDYVADNYLEEVVNLAHQNGIKVYASINMPYNYWLSRHPDWIAVLSNGQPADKYENDYDNRTVPPSRVIVEAECQELLRNIINEVINYDVDGIDINDNFQFPTQYLEESDTTLFSSFDDFTIKKFEKDTNLVIQGYSPKEQAEYIENHSDIYLSWLSWRAEQINQLLKILKQDIKETGHDIPLRPHLLTSEEPHSYYGLDYQGIAKEVDVLYLMITPDEEKEKYFEIIKKARDTQANPVRNTISNGAKKIAVSTYLFEEEDWEAVERDKGKILERMKWIKGAGADELYLYNFGLIEEGNLWSTIKNIFEKI